MVARRNGVHQAFGVDVQTSAEIIRDVAQGAWEDVAVVNALYWEIGGA